jgi:hypothetical protein
MFQLGGGNLNELGQLRVCERGLQELEIDCVFCDRCNPRQVVWRHRRFRHEFVTDSGSQALRHVSVIRIGRYSRGIAVKPLVGFAIGRDEAIDDSAALRQRIGIDDMNTDGLISR